MMYPLPFLSRACRCACIRACVGAYSRVHRVLAVLLASELMFFALSVHLACVPLCLHPRMFLLIL